MICLEQNITTGALQVIDPQPSDLSSCALVAGSYSEFSTDVWHLTAEEGALIGGQIFLVWAIAFGFRMVVRAIHEIDSEKEST